MFVAASLECLPQLEFSEAVELLSDLEFGAIEVDLHTAGHVNPASLLTEPEKVVRLVRHSHRLHISGYSVDIDLKGEPFYELFAEVCKFAKATRVVTLTVRSGELGTPFNQEVEHLQRLVDLAEAQGARIAVKCEIGRLSEDPDTLMVLCDNVHGLGITLDLSVFTCGPAKNKNLDRILKYVFNLHLRDSSPTAFHVSIGQGEIDYGRWITMLEREKYDRALTVHVPPIEGLEHRVELRKLRRLLESSL